MLCVCRYKGLSLSRKAFRFLRSFADLVTASTHAATIGAKGVPGMLGTLQWVLMAAHIFWDNMFFATHPIVVRRLPCAVPRSNSGDDRRPTPLHHPHPLTSLTPLTAATLSQ